MSLTVTFHSLAWLLPSVCSVQRSVQTTRQRRMTKRTRKKRKRKRKRPGKEALGGGTVSLPYVDGIISTVVAENRCQGSHKFVEWNGSRRSRFPPPSPRLVPLFHLFLPRWSFRSRSRAVVFFSLPLSASLSLFNNVEICENSPAFQIHFGIYYFTDRFTIGFALFRVPSFY